MKKGALGVALYNSAVDQFTHYADPGKVKVYLGTGLPIIITDVPYVAKEIEKNKCGVIVRYEEKDIVKAVIRLMENENELRACRKNAIKYAEQFDWDRIFFKALGDL